MNTNTKEARLSDSSLKLLHTCERLYQLDRILAPVTEKSHYPATVFGTAWGAGVQDYLTYKDQDKALFQLWCSYNPRMEDAVRTQEICANMLIAAFPVLDSLLQDWEIVFFEQKPATELSFRINIDNFYYFVGYIDAVLRNRFTGKIAAFDAKTTSLKLLDLSPMYQNSPQLIGYSIVLDQAVGAELSDYDVFYLSGQLGSGTGFAPIIKPYAFSKTLQDRLHWFISLGLDVRHLTEMKELSIYPQRGHSCLQYNKPCKHFGTCQLFSFDQQEPMQMLEEAEGIESAKQEQYTFTFDLTAVIADHLRRIE